MNNLYLVVQRWIYNKQKIMWCENGNKRVPKQNNFANSFDHDWSYVESIKETITSRVDAFISTVSKNNRFFSQ